jgi:glycogen debranching enzyme
VYALESMDDQRSVGPPHRGVGASQRRGSRSSAPSLDGLNRENLKQRVLTLFQTNFRTGYSNWLQAPYAYIAPAKHGYPHQWLWDTAFQSVVLSHIDPSWAEREIENFLQVQGPNGFLPHVIFWDERHVPFWGRLLSDDSLHPHYTSITQPPVLALAVEAIYTKSNNRQFLARVVPKVSAYHHWLASTRDPYQSGLLSIISADESGMDELPVFQYAGGLKHNNFWVFHYFNRKADVRNKFYGYDLQRILRADYFTVKEIIFNCIYIESSRALARLHRVLGDSESAAVADQRAKVCTDALMNLCWNDQDQIFYPVYSKRNKTIPVKTVTSLVPLFLTDLDAAYAERLIKTHLLNPNEFNLPYPIPSVAKCEVFFHPETLPFYWIKALWRGPTWFSTNWLVVKGLLKHGYDDIASGIIARMGEMVERGGFREYFNPLTGKGYGKHNFGWSTLLLDLI